MSFFQVLQVIIAIIFIYLTLSLLVTEIQEAFAGFLQFRAKNLKDSITILLGENPRGKKVLTNKIYETHRIKSINQYTGTWLNWINWILLPIKPFKIGPSYIKKEDFAEAVLEYLDKELDHFLTKNPNDPNIITLQHIIDKIEKKINTEGKENFGEPVLEKLEKDLNNLNDDLKKTDKETQREKVKQIKAKIENKETEIKEVKQIIAELQNKESRSKHLDILLKIAQSIKLKQKSPKLQDFREELESLFEKAEKRTIGVYRRNAKGVSFLLGFLLAMFLNIDFFYIVDKVAKNPKLTALLNENAEKVVKEESKAAYNTYEECLKTPGKDCGKQFLTVQKELQASIPECSSLSGIFGWGNTNETPPQLTIPIFNKTIETKTIPWIIHLPGWIISAIAMAMGAPFWFDLLGKFLNVRNAAKPFEPKLKVPKKEEDKKKKAE